MSDNDFIKASTDIELEVIPADQKEIFRIVPTRDGFDIVLGEGVTMTEAARVFVEHVRARFGIGGGDEQDT